MRVVPLHSFAVDCTLLTRQFEGVAQCGIQASDLYALPASLEDTAVARKGYCHNRGELLQAMSDGGRYGFDTPYSAKGEHSVVQHVQYTKHYRLPLSLVLCG